MAAHQGRHYLFFCTSGFASFFVQADLQSDCYSLGFPILFSLLNSVVYLVYSSMRLGFSPCISFTSLMLLRGT